MSHRVYPEIHINPTLLTKLYKMHGIKKRVIQLTKNINPKKSKGYTIWKEEMAEKLKIATAEGYRIIYIDETMFTRNTIKKGEYCLPKFNTAIQ